LALRLFLSGREIMPMVENLEYLSTDFLDEVLRLSDNTKAKYSKALSLITEGMRPERAFRESGFTDAYRKERESDGEEKTKTD
jgi:hypothetical protein